MTYRITVKTNPKSLLIVAVVIALPVGAILSFSILPIFLSIILLVIGGYISYHLGKYIYNVFQTRIETSDEGLRFKMTSKEATSLQWGEVTHSGYCIHEKEKPSAFVYAEAKDKLLTIPSEYQGFDDLIDELRAHLTVEEISLKQTETVSSYLRDVIGITKDEDETESEKEESEKEDDS